MIKEEQNKIIEKLSELYANKSIEYAGDNRFICTDKYRTTNRELWTPPILLDEYCQEIKLKNRYDNIFQFTKGFAVVCIRGNVIINNEHSFSQTRLDGIIDKNGNEILPCAYDRIHIYLDGHVVLTQNGVKKSTNLDLISKVEYTWNSAMNWNH